MTQAEIEAVLQAAFGQCETAGYSLSTEQKQIILNVMLTHLDLDWDSETASSDLDTPNPLEELTPNQRQALLEFVQEQGRQGRSWKIQLLNDWLQERESGSIQFIREQYGPQWLDRVQPRHLARYSDRVPKVLKTGDRIEVSNSLWEWVQEDGPCSQEWFPCTVTALSEAPENMPMVPQRYKGYTSCTIRFDNGMEYEIQGIYEWNRYNWRWPGAE